MANNGIYNGSGAVNGLGGRGFASGRPLDQMVRNKRAGDMPGPESGLAFPHSIQFASMIGGAWRSFLADRWDEALRAGRTEANCMRRDCYIQALIQERALATASLKWHIEVDNARDPAQRAIKDGLTAIVRAIPHFQRLILCLVDETVWVGRGGTQLAFYWRDMHLPQIPKGGMNLGGIPGQGVNNPNMLPAPISPFTKPSPLDKRRALCVQVHQPVSGDSINHTYEGNPLILLNTGHAADLPNALIELTTKGRALSLTGSWRQRFLLHQHIPVAAEFFDYEKAEAIHGVGIRSIIYWWNELRLEWISNTADWIERTGLGVRIWHYQAGNEKSKSQVSEAARQQTDKVNILVPVSGERGVEDVQFVDTASAGADLLLKLVEYADGFIERYVIGQSMSSGADNESGLGGSGRAKLAENTKGRIIAFDANNVAESITEDLLKTTLRWTYPDHADLPVRFVLETDDPDPQQLMTAAKTFQDMGGAVKEDDIRGKIGLSEPMEGDKILQPPQQQQQGGMPGQPGAPGAPPPSSAALGPQAPTPKQSGSPVNPDGSVPETTLGQKKPEQPVSAAPEQPRLANGDSAPFDFAREGKPDHYRRLVEDTINDELAQRGSGLRVADGEITEKAGSSEPQWVDIGEMDLWPDQYQMDATLQADPPAPIAPTAAPPVINVTVNVPEQPVTIHNAAAAPPDVHVVNHMPEQKPAIVNVTAPVVNVPAPTVTVNVPEQPTPIFNVESPQINLPPAVVNVAAPVVNLPQGAAPVVNVMVPDQAKADPPIVNVTVAAPEKTGSVRKRAVKHQDGSVTITEEPA